MNKKFYIFDAYHSIEDFFNENCFINNIFENYIELINKKSNTFLNILITKYQYNKLKELKKYLKFLRDFRFVMDCNFSGLREVEIENYYNFNSECYCMNADFSFFLDDENIRYTIPIFGFTFPFKIKKNFEIKKLNELFEEREGVKENFDDQIEEIEQGENLNVN